MSDRLELLPIFKRVLLAGVFSVALPAVFINSFAFAQGNLPQVRGHVNKGNYLLGRGQFQEAIAEYEEALKLDPANVVARNNIVEVHNNWAISCYARKKYGDALEQWQKALELDPNHRNARRNLALMKQMMAQQGLSVGGSSSEGSPEGADKRPSKGPSAAKPPAAGAGVPKEDPSTSVSGPVLILTPGLRQPQGPKPGEMDQSALPPDPASLVPCTAGSVSASQTPSPPQPGQSSSPPPSQAQSQSSIFTPADNPSSVRSTQGSSAGAARQVTSPLFPVTPEQFPRQVMPAASSVGLPPQVAPSGSPAALPSPAASLLPGPSSSGKGGGIPGSLEDQLAAIELKIYGQKANDLTVMQRLEKMEKDTAGLVRSGTITERINYLKQSYGL